MQAQANRPGTNDRTLTIIYVIIAVLAIAGLTDAIYLTVQTLTGETLICGGSADCSKVLGSSYAHVGPVPLAALGTVAYFSVFSLATLAAFRYRHARTLLVTTVGLMLAITLWLLFVQAFRLHAFCRYCLFSAAITFLLAGLIVATPSANKS